MSPVFSVYGQTGSIGAHKAVHGFIVPGKEGCANIDYYYRLSHVHLTCHCIQYVYYLHDLLNLHYLSWTLIAKSLQLTLSLSQGATVVSSISTPSDTCVYVMCLCRCHGFRLATDGSMCSRGMLRRYPWWKTCWRTTRKAAPSPPCCTSTAHKPSDWKVGPPVTAFMLHSLPTPSLL